MKKEFYLTRSKNYKEKHPLLRTRF